MTTLSTEDKLALFTAELDASRAQMTAHKLGIKRATSPGDQLKRSFREHKSLFFGSAIALGLLLALIPSGEKKSKRFPKRRRTDGHQQPPDETENNDPPKGGHPLLAAASVTITKMIWDAARPTLLKWLKENAFARPYSTHSPNINLGEAKGENDLMK